MELIAQVHWKNNKEVDNKFDKQNTQDGLRGSGQWVEQQGIEEK